MGIKITILFDNYINENAKDKNLQALWGFSAFVDYYGKKILFDTGSNGRVLKNNAENLGINLAEAQYLFISHPHWDHIGGWDTVLEINPSIHPIVPASMSQHLIADLEQLTGNITVVDDEHLVIDQGITSTGIMQPEGEQALILNSQNGLVVLVGCSHPGIINILERVKQIYSDQPIHYVIGGFHLLYHSEDQIQEVVDKLDTELITPTHCTGEVATEMIKQKFGPAYIEGGVGQVVELM